MRMLRIAAAATTLVIVSACSDGRGIADPAASSAAGTRAASSEAARRVETSGQFVAQVDFSTLTLTPRGSNCLLTVNGQLVFTGTIAGTGVGQTKALVSAPCADVATSPPGTFSDVFKSELRFIGTIGGVPVAADMRYIGRVQPGGAIEAHLVLSHGAAGVLNTSNARVAVGGDYSGQIVVP